MGEMTPVSPAKVATVSDYRLRDASGNPRPKGIWFEHTGAVVRVLGAQVGLTWESGGGGASRFSSSREAEDILLVKNATETEVRWIRFFDVPEHVIVWDMRWRAP